jgi:hypothetical protein
MEVRFEHLTDCKKKLLTERPVFKHISQVHAQEQHYVFINGIGVELSPPLLQPFIGLLKQTWMLGGDDCGRSVE